MTEKHIMLDTETLGVEYDAVILSVCIVEFNPRTGRTFDILNIQHINVNQSIRAGHKVEPDTLAWWVDNGIQRIVDTQRYDYHPSIEQVHQFLNQRTNFPLWGKSPWFDLEKLKYAFRLNNLSVPWHHHNIHDLRTLLNITNPEALSGITGNAGKHIALHDCLHQINQLCCVLKYLGNTTTYH